MNAGLNIKMIVAFGATLLIGASIAAAIRGGKLTRDLPEKKAEAEKAAAGAKAEKGGAEKNAEDPHAGHDMSGKKAEKSDEADPHAGHDMTGKGGAKNEPPTVIDLKNEKCPVMGGTAQADIYTDYEGVRIHWCCPGCDSTFKKNPKKYLKKLGIDDLDAYKKKHGSKKTGEAAGGDDESRMSAPPDKAPIIDLKNEKCPVMGGKAQADVYTDYQGVRIHWCCPGCDRTFMKDPKKYLKKLGIDDLDAYKKKHRAEKPKKPKKKTRGKKGA